VKICAFTYVHCDMIKCTYWACFQYYVISFDCIVACNHYRSLFYEWNNFSWCKRPCCTFSHHCILQFFRTCIHASIQIYVKVVVIATSINKSCISVSLSSQSRKNVFLCVTSSLYYMDIQVNYLFIFYLLFLGLHDFFLLLIF
jgi:hypothetical protein